MTANTDLQRQLHEELISEEARMVMETAGAMGASGWKVNGAGGEGGSVTILCGPEKAAKSRIGSALSEADPLFGVIPTTLSPEGVRTSEA
jgi:D-glycero-alpha-D-manno-heptose-7-phosphate kinase